MKIDSRTIDNIVAGVLRQLGASPSVRVAEPHERREEHPAAEHRTSNNTTRLLDAAVVTEEVLRTHSSGREPLVLRDDAILTPSGRDWLRQQKIAWQRASGVRRDPSPRPDGWRLIVGGKSEVADQAIELAETLGWSHDRVADADAVRPRAISLLGTGESAGVIAVSDRPERLACRANRSAEIRAAVVQSVEDAKRIRQELGANLLILPTHDKTYFELRNLFQAIAAGGPPNEPADW
jgi:hypothetical protein